jgi:hypothetical protein
MVCFGTSALGVSMKRILAVTLMVLAASNAQLAFGQKPTIIEKPPAKTLPAPRITAAPPAASGGLKVLDGCIVDSIAFPAAGSAPTTGFIFTYRVPVTYAASPLPTGSTFRIDMSTDRLLVDLGGPVSGARPGPRPGQWDAIASTLESAASANAKIHIEYIDQTISSVNVHWTQRC